MSATQFKRENLFKPSGELWFRLSLIFADPNAFFITHRSLEVRSVGEQVVCLFGPRGELAATQLRPEQQTALHVLLVDYRTVCQLNSPDRDTWILQYMFGCTLHQNGEMWLCSHMQGTAYKCVSGTLRYWK